MRSLAPAFGSPVALAGAIGCLIVLLTALLGPPLAPYDPLDQNILARLTGASAAHWLGADEYGRDLLSRILYGARASVLISLSSVGVSLVIGLLVGVFAGYRRGWADILISEAANLFLAFPTVVVGILVLVALGGNSVNIVIALAISFIPRFIRLARAETMAVAQKTFVEAARASGASDLRIMLRYVLPNVVGTAIVSAALWTATALRAEATLSFLGLGVQLPYPSWGNLISDGMPYVFSNPGLVLFPCLAIVVAVVSFNLLGDALRDFFDPKSREG